MISDPHPCLTDEQLAALASDVNLRAADRTSLLEHVSSCDRCSSVLSQAMEGEEIYNIGRYEVRGTLGAGGMGVVLLGWDPSLGRDVALKVISTQASLARHSLLDEAKALAAVRHHNVVAVHDVGEVDGEIFIAMERVHGVQFQHWWPDHPASARLTALTDLATGLAAMHGANLLHRDIKPANIIMTPSDQVVIVDLGLAVPVSSLSTAVVAGAPAVLAAGTVGYVAPEVMAGAAPTPRSDQYAFWRVVEEAMREAELPRAESLRLQRLIARGVHSDPNQRLPSLSDCAAALRACSPRQPRRGRVALVAIGLAAAGAVTFALWPRHAVSSCAPLASGWPSPLRPRVQSALASQPEVAARVTAFIDASHKTANDFRQQSCRDQHDPNTRAAALRTELCIDWAWQRVLIDAAWVAKGSDPLDSVEELAMSMPLTRCADAQSPSVPAPPPESDVTLVRALSIEARVAAATTSDETRDNLRERIEAVSYPPLLASWQLNEASRLAGTGNLTDARRLVSSAAQHATAAGDDFLLARIRLVEMDLAGQAGAVTDAQIRDVEAVVQRVASPGLTAQFKLKWALILISEGDLTKARELLIAARETFDSLALAPSAWQGSAAQNLGVVLQYSQDLAGAQPLFEQAVKVLTARYGADNNYTIGAATAAASNLLYLGRAEDADRELRRLQALLQKAGQTSTPSAVDVGLALCQVSIVMKSSDAKDACQLVVEQSAALYGESAPQLTAPLLQLAQVTMDKNVSDAIPLLERAINIATKGGGNPNELAYGQGLLALAYADQKRRAEGLSLAKAAVLVLDQLGQASLAQELRETFSELPRE